MIMEGQLTLSPVMQGYQDAFNQLIGSDNSFYNIRQQAFEGFLAGGFPTTRNEDWKYTNLMPLVKELLSPVLPTSAGTDTTFKAIDINGLAVNRIVFVDGKFDARHSVILDQINGLHIGSLGDAIHSAEHEPVRQYFESLTVGNNALLNLNTALAADGAFIAIPKGAVLQHPVLVQYVVTGMAAGHSFHPLNIIVAGANSQATIIEAYQHSGEGHTLYNTATHFQLLDNAVVSYHKLHTGAGNHFFVSNTSAKIERNATFNAYHVNLDGALVRNNVEVNLDGEGAHADLKGLYAIDGKEHVDNHVVIKHNAPHCTSNQLYKGLMDGQSTGVFNGRIYVAIDAQKTNAFQSNKNVLLSPDANSYSKPQLEIFADDVKCSHGSTTGQIDKTALFYLQARGIDKAMALAMLNEAFAADVLRDIAIEPLKKWYEQAIAEKLHSENFIS